MQDPFSPEGVIPAEKEEKEHSVNHYLGNLNKCLCAHILITDENLSTFGLKDMCRETTKRGKERGREVRAHLQSVRIWV